MKHTLLLIAGWLVACFVLFAALFAIDIDLNLLSWDPKWDWRVALLAICVLVSLTSIWFLARATRDRVSLIASLVVCLTMIGFALSILPAEETDFLRTSPSPWWFRGTIAALMGVPAVWWLTWLLRHRSHLRHSTAP
jgi:hypothetical protein